MGDNKLMKWNELARILSYQSNPSVTKSIHAAQNKFLFSCSFYISLTYHRTLSSMIMSQFDYRIFELLTMPSNVRRGVQWNSLTFMTAFCTKREMHYLLLHMYLQIGYFDLVGILEATTLASVKPKCGNGNVKCTYLQIRWATFYLLE